MKYFLIMLAIIFIIFVIRSLYKNPYLKEIAPADELKEKLNLTTENQEEINIVSENVPKHLRDLIPMAEKWGIGDDIIRDDFETKTSIDEKQEFKKMLTGRTQQVTDWLDSFKDGLDMTVEAGHFMYMLEALDEMGLWPDQQ